MYITNEWYIFHEVIDKKTCNKIKRLAHSWEDASVDTQKETTDEERLTGRKGDFKTKSTIRTSDVCWVKDQWVYNVIWPYMLEANHAAGWRFHIKAAESLQITRYKKGGFYNFHRDGMGDHLSVNNETDNPYLYGNVRKLSMTLLLNDTYEGGEFQLSSYGKQECTITVPKFNLIGSIIVFPSGMEHRVAPITKGLRYSLVAWFVGPPFV